MSGQENLVQSLMLSREDWEEHLKTNYAIKITPDRENNHIVSLKYDQIGSPMRELIVRQCRGMVIDKKNKLVLARPYDKFWNWNDSLVDPIDWDSATVQEKVDGSLMILYHYEGNWHVASSGHPTAGGAYDNSGNLFRNLFWTTWVSNNMLLPEDTSISYMFELCTSFNKIVVKHEVPKLIFHGARYLTGQYLSQSDMENISSKLNWELVRSFPLTSFEKAIEAAKELNGAKQEGFVVFDSAHRRVKIKSPSYVALHHMKGDASPRRAMELWKNGDTAELLNVFPEFTDVIVPVQLKLDAIVRTIFEKVRELSHIESQKEFAIKVKDKPWAFVAFLMRRHNITTLESTFALVREAPISALEKLYEMS